MWNIDILGLYKKVPRVVKYLQALFPLAILALIIKDLPTFKSTFLNQAEMPLGLLIYGMLGQFIYEIRSVYQLVYSYKLNKSVLPLGHWVLAVIGSQMIISYGIIRHDWVLAIGQFSIFFSIRNLILSLSPGKEE